jgi:hypothetical protein
MRRCGCRVCPTVISSCKPVNGTAISTRLKNLPERPPRTVARPGEPDPIGAMIHTIEAASDPDNVTGSLPAAGGSSSDRSATRPEQTDQKSRPEPWRQRLIRSLLYGRNVDRAAKARARVGLAMLAFGGGLRHHRRAASMMFADRRRHPRARAAPRRRTLVATARPDIVDRNGAILATDVKSPSLFSASRAASSTRTRRSSLLTGAPCLTSTSAEVRERIMSKKGFAWLKREITAKQQQRHPSRLGIPGIGFLRENKRVYPSGAAVSHLIGLVQHRQSGHRRHGEMARQSGALRICTARASHPTVCKSRSSSPSTCASSMHCVTNF